MDLREHFAVIWARRLWIIGISLLVAVGVYALRSQSNERFEASTIIRVIPGRTPSSGETFLQQDTAFLTRTFVELATTRDVLAEAADLSGLDLDADDVRDRVTITSASGGLGFLTIETTGDAAGETQAVAEGLADALIAAVEEDRQFALERGLEPLDAEVARIEALFAESEPGSSARESLELRLRAVYDAIVAQQASPSARLEVVATPDVQERDVQGAALRDAIVAFILTAIVSAEAFALVEAARGRLSRRDPLADAVLVAGAPVLAALPRSRRRSDRDEFRQLRTRIVLLLGEPPDVTTVVSLDGRTRRSGVAGNLAVALGTFGRTVVVDADVRTLRPGAPTGLSEALAAPEDPKPYLMVHAEPGGPELMPAGRGSEDPAALLGHGALAGVVQQLAQLAECAVVLDPAPLGGDGDALVVVHECPAAVILVANVGVRRSFLAGAAESVRSSGGHLVGVVLVGLSGRAVRSSRLEAGSAPQSSSPVYIAR